MSALFLYHMLSTTLTFLVVLGSGVNAVQFIQNNTVPANLTAACSSALVGDVNCSPVVAALRSGSYYPQSTLNKTCTADCANALSAYESNVLSACGGQTWNGYQDTEMPLAIIPDMFRYLYNLTCLMDSGRYCNVVSAAAAQASDPGSGDAVTGISIATANVTATGNVTNSCDMCFIRALQFEAGSPYYNGPLLAEQSIYESKTSSCGVTGYPLTTTDLSFYTATATPTPSPTACAGATYSIKTTDDCYSISKSQDISTGWLLLDNNLQAYCADFPTNGTLCLSNTCGIYTVQANDTCVSISSAYNITVSQLLAWNPVVNAGCYNLNKMDGAQVCISAPGKPYVTPSISVLAPSVATTAAPVPTSIANGTNKDCGQYYEVVPGDYCNMIVIKFGISLSDFIFLNPVINVNCTNLFAGESYCVEAVGDINTYSGRPGYSTPGPTGVQTTAIFSNLPDATYTTPISTTTSFPLANGTRTDCNSYFSGDIFQMSLTGSNWNSQCELAAAVYSVDLSSFGIWNPGLGNVNLPSCSFQKGVQYCGKLYFGEAPQSSSDSDLPIRTGASPNCTLYADVIDGWTCESVLDTYDLTIAQFYAYNPAVGSDCSTLVLGYQYCIRTPDYVEQTISSISSTGGPSVATLTTGEVSPTPTSPIQSGQPTNCKIWYTAQSGDSCASVENVYFITDAQFHAWNPSVSTDCSAGFWAGYAYCVATTDVTVSRTSSAFPTSTTASAAVPSPTQANNAVLNCNNYAIAQSGDSCSIFASRNGVTLANLYAWNSVLGSDGSGCANEFWAGYYYCVGASG